jgi:hypothetical protein
MRIFINKIQPPTFPLLDVRDFKEQRRDYLKAKNVVVSTYHLEISEELCPNTDPKEMTGKAARGENRRLFNAYVAALDAGVSIRLQQWAITKKG